MCACRHQCLSCAVADQHSITTLVSCLFLSHFRRRKKKNRSVEFRQAGGHQRESLSESFSPSEQVLEALTYELYVLRFFFFSFMKGMNLFPLEVFFSHHNRFWGGGEAAATAAAAGAAAAAPNSQCALSEPRQGDNTDRTERSCHLPTRDLPDIFFFLLLLLSSEHCSRKAFFFFASTHSRLSELFRVGGKQVGSDLQTQPWRLRRNSERTRRSWPNMKLKLKVQLFLNFFFNAFRCTKWRNVALTPPYPPPLPYYIFPMNRRVIFSLYLCVCEPHLSFLLLLIAPILCGKTNLSPGRCIRSAV